MFEFDPDRVAALEAAGWRAYYDRKWVQLAQGRAAINHASERDGW
jgi:hypothetical protein